MIIENDKLVRHEKVTGYENRVTKARETVHFLHDGKLNPMSEYLQNGSGYMATKSIIKKHQKSRLSLNS